MSVSTQRRFFGVIAEPQSYLNIFYLLLAFPLGIASFVMVVVLVTVTGALLGALFYYWVDDGIDFFGIWWWRRLF